MIIITSMSPGHANKEQQHLAIESWNRYGKCYSMNTKDEIEVLSHGNFKGIHFIQTEKTIEHYCGRPLVNINAIIDVARNQGKDLMVINSDIILKDIPELNHDGVTVFSRYDYSDSIEDAKLFIHGFDVFIIPKHILKIFPPSIYGLGAAFWDYAVPFHCIQNNIPVYYPEGKYAFHKLHATQYSMEEWYYIGNFFKWQFRFDNKLTIEQIATLSLSKIKNYFTR